MAREAPRIPPLSPSDFSPEQAELVGDWTHLNFSKVIVRHPGMYRVFLPYIDQSIRGTKLPPRDREVLVLRALALCDETYEMRHHEDIARRAGMSDAEIAAAAKGEASLSSWDRVLVSAAEELLRGRRIADVTWAALAERYSEEQLMDVVFLVGCYDVMAMLTKSFGVAVEGDADTLDQINELRQYT